MTVGVFCVYFCGCKIKHNLCYGKMFFSQCAVALPQIDGRYLFIVSEFQRFKHFEAVLLHIFFFLFLGACQDILQYDFYGISSGRIVQMSIDFCRFDAPVSAQFGDRQQFHPAVDQYRGEGVSRDVKCDVLFDASLCAPAV